MRKVPIITGRIYHIFNRGVNKNNIFFDKSNYRRFLDAAIHYTNKTSKFSYEKTAARSNRQFNDPGSLSSLNLEAPRIKILTYCLMPNHFHFLIQQLVDNGLTSYIQHLTNSYSHYLNTKYRRIGPLFQGRFKNIPVESDEQLIHVSRYIHLNPLVSDLVSDLKDYRWSSYLNYIEDYDDGFCDPQPVLKIFQSRKAYKQFILDQADYGRTLEKIKHLIPDY